ncbi:MAG TPA: hypothetical protein VG722_10005 [Tepidisphaeraceae bacterium]|nr:hypothetical protein [Tepidisphaeraceae bacterium]
MAYLICGDEPFGMLLAADGSLFAGLAVVVENGQNRFPAAKADLYGWFPFHQPR